MAAAQRKKTRSCSCVCSINSLVNAFLASLNFTTPVAHKGRVREERPEHIAIHKPRNIPVKVNSNGQLKFMHRSQDIHSALSAKQSHQKSPGSNRPRGENAKKLIVWTLITCMAAYQNGKKNLTHLWYVWRGGGGGGVFSICQFSGASARPYSHSHTHMQTARAQYSSAFQITRRRALGVYLSVAGCQRRAVPYMKHIRVCMWIVEVSFALLTTHGRLAAERGRWMVGITAAEAECGFCMVSRASRQRGLVLAFCCRLRFIKI
jgi:hypothetical protein